MAKEHELCQYTVKVWKKEIPSNVGKQETFVEKVKKGYMWIFWWNGTETTYEF